MATRRSFFLTLMVTLSCALTARASQAGETNQMPFDGVYEILICKNVCTSASDENVMVKGHLVLFSTAMEPRDIDRYGPVLFPGRPGLPNACFVLEKVNKHPYTGYAGIEKSSLTMWSRVSGGVSFALYHSPDAGYEVTAEHTAKGLQGKGISWGAGVAEPKNASPDMVFARWIGEADVTQCAPSALARPRQ